jgi:hypothetical protein
LAVEKNNPSVQKGLHECLYTDHCSTSRPLVSTPTTSSDIETPDLQPPGPSASLVETAETPENTEGDPDAPEPPAEGDIYVILL